MQVLMSVPISKLRGANQFHVKALQLRRQRHCVTQHLRAWAAHIDMVSRVHSCLEICEGETQTRGNTENAKKHPPTVNLALCRLLQGHPKARPPLGLKPSATPKGLHLRLKELVPLLAERPVRAPVRSLRG